VDLEKHPGYLGFTSKGVIAIHADWPMYPLEHGWGEALLAFGSLPKSTNFAQINDIDRCLLFVAGPVSPSQDPFDSRFSHVAAWYEDLADLAVKGFVEGVELISQYEADLGRWEQSKSYLVEQEPGEFVPLNLSKPEYDEELYSQKLNVPICSAPGLRVTDSGFAALRTLLAAEFPCLPLEFLGRVLPILDIGRTDAAVREGCVLLESSMRQELATGQFGKKLVEEYCRHLLESGAIPALIKPFQAELRNAFKYIRNDYMHNVRALEQDECEALLMRIGRLYSIVTTGKAAILTPRQTLD
jgi:hypothetical protein